MAESVGRLGATDGPRGQCGHRPVPAQPGGSKGPKPRPTPRRLRARRVNRNGGSVLGVGEPPVTHGGNWNRHGHLPWTGAPFTPINGPAELAIPVESRRTFSATTTIAAGDGSPSLASPAVDDRRRVHVCSRLRRWTARTVVNETTQHSSVHRSSVHRPKSDGRVPTECRPCRRGIGATVRTPRGLRPPSASTDAAQRPAPIRPTSPQPRRRTGPSGPLSVSS
jgi:hypothetical protein